MQSNIEKYRVIQRNTEQYEEIQRNIQKYRETQRNIEKYRATKSNIEQFREIQSNIGKHRKIYNSIEKYREMQSNIEQYREIYMNVSAICVNKKYRATHTCILYIHVCVALYFYILQQVDTLCRRAPSASLEKCFSKHGAYMTYLCIQMYEQVCRHLHICDKPSQDMLQTLDAFI